MEIEKQNVQDMFKLVEAIESAAKAEKHNEEMGIKNVRWVQKYKELQSLSNNNMLKSVELHMLTSGEPNNVISVENKEIDGVYQVI
ncbi:MAG TPA: hypothetical protein DEP72_08785 [Clostridiales bacterium]|nr:MAG: hypothetical protein A2Y18_03725 [Clostridiales bacterium GWD2_32_19]HCC08234.1 hypothetical protein [Clostridiales bacterium]